MNGSRVLEPVAFPVGIESELVWLKLVLEATWFEVLLGVTEGVGMGAGAGFDVGTGTTSK